MTIKEAFERVIKTKENACWVDLERIGEELNVEYYDYKEESDITSYALGMWLCTDSWVGYKCYFLNDKPLALSSQSGRKSKEHIDFVSKEVAVEARNYILSLIKEESGTHFNLIEDMDEDIDKGYKISFIDQVLDWKKATYNGNKVKFIEKVVEEGDLSSIATKGKFKTKDGDIVVLDISDLLFSYNVV